MSSPHAIESDAQEAALMPETQIQRLRIFQWIGLPVLAVYAVINIHLEKYSFVWIHMLTLSAMSVSWWMLRRGSSVTKSTHVFLAAMLFLTTFAPLHEDLIHSQTLWFLPAIPLAAAFILGRRQAYRYLAMAVACLFLVFAIDYFYFPIASEPFYVLDWVALRFIMLAVFSSFAALTSREASSRLIEIEIKRNQMNSALDEAEAANRSKSVFLANMSHEIRNPMNGILGTAEYLRNSGLTPEDQESIDTIARCGAHLLDIIDDILDLSKIESGELNILKKSMNLGELLEHTVSLFRAKAQEAGVKLHLHLPDMQPWLRGDSKRLSQVLSNLIGNAVKFSDRGDVHVVTTVSPDPKDDRWINLEISVVDQGIGMKPEQLSRLFGEFEQVDDSEGVERGGSGLGLAISRHLIHKMGGEIHVESEFGKGSTFTIRLSLQECLQSTHSHGALGLSQTISLESSLPSKVLVVDDQPINLKLATLLLEKLNCEVEQADNGRTAIEKCQSTQFDLIFMDIRMPVLSGLEASMLITQNPGPNQHTPIVALTGCAFDEDRQASLEAGMRDHLPKPLRRAQLQTVLDTYARPRAFERLEEAC